MHLAYKAAQVIKDQLTPDLLLSLIILKLVTNKGSYSMNTASAKSKSLLQFSEIDELKRMTDTHSIAEAKYISLVEQIPVITYIASLETPVKLLYVSQQISQLGFPAADWLDDPQGLLKRVHPEDVAVTIEAYALTYEHHVPLRCEYRLNNHDGQSRWFLNKANVVLNEAGESLFLQGVLVDITKNKETEQELSYYRRRLEELVSQRTEQLEKQCMILKSANANLDAALIELKQANSDARKSMTAPHAKIQSLAYQASHDPLTGLINRRAFEKRIARVLTSAQPNYFQHALCYLNLDHFKHINDNFGHAAGDKSTTMQQFPDYP
jgi:PAS domain S-box-containing protein